MMNHQIQLTIQGITCQGCVKTLKGIFAKAPGVHHIEIDPATGKTDLNIDPTIIDTGTIESMILNAGFDLER